MGLEHRVLFPGFLPNADLECLIANCRGMVFPSLYEGFGLPVIEGMAAGIPVACSNTTSLPEVAADAAVLFDPRVPAQMAQAIVSIVNDDELREKLVRIGLQRAAEFSDTARMAKDYYELFQRAMANGKFQNLMTGAYADGWTGPVLGIEVAPAEHAQTLEIEFTAPTFLPHAKVVSTVTRSGHPVAPAFDLMRGSSGVISLPVESAGGYYEICLSPAFVPANFGYGDDQRELTLMLKRCAVVADDGTSVEIS